MSNLDVKRYAMPILSDGRLAEPVEAERGYWMLTTDYGRDTATLEAENARLHASIELLDTLPDAHKIAEQVATIERLHDALAEFGMHDYSCLQGQFHAGRPTDDGGYETKFGDKWYLTGSKPDCTCGFEAALKEGN